MDGIFHAKHKGARYPQWKQAMTFFFMDHDQTAAYHKKQLLQCHFAHD